jgi:hypothetical protein
MRRVRCPECDTKVKVPDDHARSFIRCTSCNDRIRLDEDADADEKPKRFAISRRKKNSETDSGYLGYLPLLLVFPLLACPCLGFAHRVVGGLGSLLGFAVFLTAFIKLYLLFKRKKLFSWEDVPWYLRGGGVLLYYQVKYAIAMPKEVGVWLVLEILGVAAMIAGGVIAEEVGRSDAAQKHKEFMEALNKDKAGKVDQGKGKPANVDRDKGQPVNAAPGATGNAAIDKALADIDSQDTQISRVAAENLAKMAPNEHRALVAKRLAAHVPHENVFTDKAMVSALAVWATPEEVPTLIGVVEAKKSLARDKAIESLGNLKDQRAVGPLVRAFRDAGVRNATGQALRQIGPAAENEVLALLNDKKGFMQKDVINLLKDIGTQISVPALEALAASNNPFLRNDAKEAVAAIKARGK